MFCGAKVRPKVGKEGNLESRSEDLSAVVGQEGRDQDLFDIGSGALSQVEEFREESAKDNVPGQVEVEKARFDDNGSVRRTEVPLPNADFLLVGEEGESLVCQMWPVSSTDEVLQQGGVIGVEYVHGTPR